MFSLGGHGQLIKATYIILLIYLFLAGLSNLGVCIGKTIAYWFILFWLGLLLVCFWEAI